MMKRIRDKIQGFRPLQVISYNDWKDIKARFDIASEFLQEDNVAYLILKSDLKEAETIVLENRVHEVREVRIIGDIQKIFTTPKDEQMNELVGQIKYIRGYLGELQSWIDRKSELEHEEANGKVIIHKNKEEPINE